MKSVKSSWASALLGLGLLVAGCARRESAPVASELGDVRVEAVLRTDPPRRDDNVVEILVEDRQGRPVDGAELTLVATMPAMAGMSEMRSQAAVEPLGEGRYRGAFDLPMRGTWGVDLAVASPAGGGVVSYSLTLGRPGLLAVSGGTTGPEEVATGVITVDPRRWQTIGVRTAAVARRAVRSEVRAVGRVAFDETRLTDVSVKVAGWIGRLEADATGQSVRRGQTLFTLYSPELFAAQEEYLTALRSQEAARETTAPERADYLVAAARERLKLWDLTDAQIDALAAGGERAQYVPIVSPVSGHVIEKNVVAGAAVEPGMRLYRIAGLDRVWIEADVPESELPLIAVGQTAEVTLPNLAGARLAAEVAFVYPYLDATTRTGRVRLELANPGLELKPDTYVDVVFAIERGERLMVPESAVLFTGSRRLVFLDLGGGRLRPQEVELGARSGDGFEVLSGLEEGNVVVTSGTFLIAAESRLKSATEQWQ